MQSSARILLLLGAPFLLALRPAGDTRLNEARKCSQPVDKTPRHFIDGLLSDSVAVKDLLESDILNVMVLCVSAVDHSVLRPGAQTPGLQTISVWTTKGPSTQLEPLLQRINTAQRAHFAATGGYATTLSALSIDQISSDLRVTLTATATRWHASAEVARPTSPRCTVFDAAVDAPFPGAKGVVRCSDPV